MVKRGVRAIQVAIAGALVLGLLDLVGPRFGIGGGSDRIRLALLGVLVILLGYLGYVIRSFARARAQLELRDRELMALHDAALDLHRNLALDAVLQRVVDHARDLVGARYGALSV